MDSQVMKIIGFASVCFAFAFFMGTLLLQIYIGRILIRLFVGIMIACVIVIINGLGMMTGKKRGPSYNVGKPRSWVRAPLWLGTLLKSYVFIGAIVILCVFLIVFVTHSIVQRLFVLLAGNTVVCVLLYLKFDSERPYQ